MSSLSKITSTIIFNLGQCSHKFDESLKKRKGKMTKFQIRNKIRRLTSMTTVQTFQ